MSNVVFAAPYLLPATLRFVKGVAGLPGVRLGLVTHEPVERLPDSLRKALAAHWRIDECLDPEQLATGVRGLIRQMGTPDRLLGVLEHMQETLAEVREALGIPGMGTEVARNFRDKARMKDLLRRAGLPCARHRLVRGPEEARTFAAEAGFPLIVKPPAGAGAKATFRVGSIEQLDEALAHAPATPGRPVLLEEFVTGLEHSFDAVCIRGRSVWHSLTHYLPTPLEVLENPWIQWCVLLPREIDHPRYDDIREVGARTLEVLGMGTGLTHLEWFRRGDGSIAVSEVAARPPGGQITALIHHAHDLDFYRAWAALIVYEAFEPPARRYAAGAAFLRGQGQGRVRAVHGLDRVRREVGAMVVEASLPSPGQPRREGYEGEGYVIVRHPETRVVEEALRRIVGSIRIEVG